MIAVKMNKTQKKWCDDYLRVTTFDALMDDFLAGNESFVTAARKSIHWFESWSDDVMCAMPDIPEMP